MDQINDQEDIVVLNGQQFDNTGLLFTIQFTGQIVKYKIRNIF